MTTQTTPGSKALRLYPPPPPDFDPFTSTVADLKKHGLPLRPDPYTQPAMAALWDRQARRYRSFDHLEPQPNVAKAAETAVTPFILPLDPIETCGFSLLTSGATIGALFVTWTVPDLQYSSSPIGAPNQFHTFVGLGFLDLHVMMTVDSAQEMDVPEAEFAIPADYKELNPPGTGKTHLGIALGIKACQSGYRVAFATAQQF